MSGGAVREYSGLYPDRVVEVLAGEIIMIPASVIWSTMLSETLEDAAPMTTSAPPLINSVAPWVETFMSVESPESAPTIVTSLPNTPPAALMSSTARPTPAISGGPRKASVPVIGRIVPTTRGSEEPPAEDEGEAEVPDPPPLQAVRVRAKAATAVAAAVSRCLRVMECASQSCRGRERMESRPGTDPCDVGRGGAGRWASTPSPRVCAGP